MSGIFVDADDKFDVVLNYVEESGGIKILDEKKEGKSLSIALEEKKVGEKSLTITFKYPDFATSQGIVQNSIVTTENGQSVDAFRLRANMIYLLAIDWDAKDKDGKKIPFTIDNINKLQPAAVAYLVDKVQNKVGENSSISM